MELKRLSATVLAEAKRLGATLNPDYDPDGEGFDFDVDFTTGLLWPRQDYGDGVDPMDDGIWGIAFLVGDGFDPEEQEVEGCEGMHLQEIGIMDGGNWIILVDLAGPHGSSGDPMTYSIDHFEPGQEIEPLGRLSDFLAKLK